MNPVDWIASTDLPAVRSAVIGWYRQHGRSLPWRQTRDPYRVWVSEIMLQQTTVATVLSYYERFLARFPTITVLADAPEADVLHLWQGLGYYRRARHMHRAARLIRDQLNGQFPESLTEIEKLPGLGKYTARAIASFAHHQRAPILEANTRRLWCRVAGSAGDPTKPPLEPQLWKMAEDVLPSRRSWDFNQAAMDLGAMICVPKQPSCSICPLAPWCEARKQGLQDTLPELPSRRAKVEVFHVSLVLWDAASRRVLVRQRPVDGTWGGLWEFPHAELEPGEVPKGAATRLNETLTGRRPQWTGRSLLVRHPIMHYQVSLTCLEAQLPGPTPRSSQSGRWLRLAELSSLPFSTPQRKIIAWLQAQPPPDPLPTTPRNR